MIKVLLYEPMAEPKLLSIDSSLESMQDIVRGSIQAIYPLDSPVAVICNDDGKLLRLPPNRALKDDSGAVYDVLCGTFFVCGLTEDSFGDLEDPYIQEVKDYFAPLVMAV